MKLEDLSLGGAFVSGEDLPLMELEDNVELTIPFSDKQKEVELTGTVRRITENGVGIEFF